MTTIKEPCAVNKFEEKADAIAHAVSWSESRNEEWTVIHAPSEDGLRFFVERGDGGMIRSTERKIGTWRGGKRSAE